MHVYASTKSGPPFFRFHSSVGHRQKPRKQPVVAGKDVYVLLIHFIRDVYVLAELDVQDLYLVGSCLCGQPDTCESTQDKIKRFCKILIL